MARQASLILLTVVSPWLLLVLMFGGASSVWVGVPMICALPILLIAVSTDGLRPTVGALLGLWLLLTGSWLGLAWLSLSTDLSHPSVGEAGAVMGLMLLGLGLAPMVWVGWVFARSFSSAGLSPEDLERLREGRDR